MLNVRGNNYANCDGQYRYVYDEKVAWLPEYPLYKHVTYNRYLFRNYAGWSIGDNFSLSSGARYCGGKL